MTATTRMVWFATIARSLSNVAEHSLRTKRSLAPDEPASQTCAYRARRETPFGSTLEPAAERLQPEWTGDARHDRRPRGTRRRRATARRGLRCFRRRRRLRCFPPSGLAACGAWGYELWAAFVVSSIATGGSLFFSEIAGFVPCELCWYQRICMYPLSIITLLAAIRGTSSRPLPAAAADRRRCVSVYHILVENGVVGQSSACLVSAPGGCATKWINQFGYMTIPTLALTAFVLLIEFLALATAGVGRGRSYRES